MSNPTPPTCPTTADALPADVLHVVMVRGASGVLPTDWSAWHDDDEPDDYRLPFCEGRTKDGLAKAQAAHPAGEFFVARYVPESRAEAAERALATADAEIAKMYSRCDTACLAISGTETAADWREYYLSRIENELDFRDRLIEERDKDGGCEWQQERVPPTGIAKLLYDERKARKEAERALAEKEAELAILLQSEKDAVWELEQARRELSESEAELAGVKAERDAGRELLSHIESRGPELLVAIKRLDTAFADALVRFVGGFAPPAVETPGATGYAGKPELWVVEIDELDEDNAPVNEWFVPNRDAIDGEGRAFSTREHAERHAASATEDAPGYRWRVVRYVPEGHHPAITSSLSKDTPPPVPEVVGTTDSELIREAEALGIDVVAHLCGCEVCAHTSQLCPATRSSLALEIEEARADRCEAPGCMGGMTWVGGGKVPCSACHGTGQSQPSPAVTGEHDWYRVNPAYHHPFKWNCSKCPAQSNDEKPAAVGCPGRKPNVERNGTEAAEKAAEQEVAQAGAGDRADGAADRVNSRPVQEVPAPETQGGGVIQQSEPVGRSSDEEGAAYQMFCAGCEANDEHPTMDRVRFNDDNSGGFWTGCYRFAFAAGSASVAAGEQRWRAWFAEHGHDLLTILDNEAHIAGSVYSPGRGAQLRKASGELRALGLTAAGSAPSVSRERVRECARMATGILSWARETKAPHAQLEKLEAELRRLCDGE